MRSALVCLLPALSTLPACTDAAITDESSYASLRERLEHEDTRLLVASPRSAGSVRAERLVGDGWEVGLVDLHLESGEIIMRAAGNALLLERLDLGIAPIEVPASVTGHRARLVDVRVALVEPLLAPAVWTADDGEATVSARVKLDLSWSVAVDDTTISLGAPTLPPIPLDLTLTGTGEIAHAEIRLRAAGEIWSWADLVRLVDLFVLVGADG